MTREQLEHIIRAVASISGENSIVIIGSQAILGSYADAPASLLTSMEADAFPADAPEKSDIIDGCIGELSPFHETYGYYAHGITPDAAELPAHWRSRLVRVESPATQGNVGLCLSPADLAVSKLLAGRDKDIDFVRGMLSAQLVTLTAIQELEQELSPKQQARLAALYALFPEA
ncbi:MAG: hypothetical protein ISS31_09365 [Kiritimatiellae bacterium]|nr:hypothetical protein [Kiritimatiellia bacterium]